MYKTATFDRYLNLLINFILKCVMGVGVANVVKVPALVVCIDPVGVRVPAVATTKMDVGVTPPQKVAQ